MIQARAMARNPGCTRLVQLRKMTISRARRELLDAQRQEPPCRAFCADHGWQVVEVYMDDNRSAWKEGIRRDDFERMLGDVRAGRLDAIVSWQADRLLRTVVDASAIVAIAKQQGTLVANVGGELDLSTAAGRKKFYDLAVAAEYASDLASERLSSSMLSWLLMGTGKVAHDPSAMTWSPTRTSPAAGSGTA